MNGELYDTHQIDMKRRPEEADDLFIDLTFFCQNAVV